MPMKLKKAGIITKIVIIAIVIYASVTLISLRRQIADASARQETLQQQIAEMEAANAELEYALEHSSDEDVLAGIARDELGLVGADEKVFYDNGN